MSDVYIPCWEPCDTDCECGPIHCLAWHMPRHHTTILTHVPPCEDAPTDLPCRPSRGHQLEGASNNGHHLTTPVQASRAEPSTGISPGTEQAPTLGLGA